jgi:AcrR family transcriptional regulator
MTTSSTSRLPTPQRPASAASDTASPSGRKVNTRERLLEATIDVVAQSGYINTAVADVISRAGASRSTFYEQFSDKDDCFIAALRQVSDRLLTDIEDSLRADKGKDAPTTVVSVLMHFVTERQPAARVLLTESLAGNARARDERDCLIDRIAELIEHAGSMAPQDAPCLDLPTSAMVGGVFRLLSMRLRRGESGLHELLPDLLAWMNNYAIPHGPPRWQALPPLPVLEPRIPAPSIPTPAPLPRGRHRLPAVDVAHNQRSRILQATAEITYEKGYAAVTVADIVATARTSRKIFYAHFRDKQQAATEVQELTFQQGMTACAGAFFAAATWPERVWAGGHALLDFIANYPNLVNLGFVEVHAIGPASAQRVQDRLMAFTLFLEEGYSYRPQAKTLPRFCSEALAAVMFELGYKEVRQHRRADHLPYPLPSFVYTCLAPFMGSQQATDFVEAKIREVEASR